MKSGWAAVIVLSGTVSSPRILTSSILQMSDATVPETRQPYHRRTGELETKSDIVQSRIERVQQVIAESLSAFLSTTFLSESQPLAAVVGGGKADPSSIANAHIKAHALEGRLFVDSLWNELRRRGIEATIVREAEIWQVGTRELGKSLADLRLLLGQMGTAIRPWRMEQKIAALGAWLSLVRTTIGQM